LLEPIPVRSIGPAVMGGRVTDVAVVAKKPSTMYVAAASGGLWKTVNSGSTWTPVFDQQATLSIGAVAVAPSKPLIVWVGTGEANPRNSVSWGNGVYRSTDGGATWQHAGLAETEHIGRIIIHPANPDIVYVAALGRLWGPNTQRGVFKTTDSGRTWQQINYINEDTGFIDLAMDPHDPSILYAAAYQVRRGPFSGGNPAMETGPGSGLYRSVDDGHSWVRLTRGLPDRPLGRCGLGVSKSDPRVVMAVVQTDQTGSTTAGQAAKESTDVELGGIFRSEDWGETWTKLNDLCPRPFYYGQIRIDPADNLRVYVLGQVLHLSEDGGRTFQDMGAKVHADQHALWINPTDPRHLVVGNDGGLFFSNDGGATWDHVNNLPISQFYGIAVDMCKPYRIYGGLQDNGTWGGPSATLSAEGITNAAWFRVLSADGFQCQVDPLDPDMVYAESQYGGLRRIDLRTSQVTEIHPRPAEGEPAYRFNWNSPVLLSSHDRGTLFYGANHVLRTRNQGDAWKIVSPDLTRGKPGPASDFGHTITALAESPLKAGLLYAGTDDGRIHVSHNGSRNWIDITDRLLGVPALSWITRLECSHHAEGTAYLTLDRHRQNDRAPYIFKTTDYGLTWQALANNLPAEGPVHVIREDSHNPDLLFVGTEFGLFVSGDGGGHWHRIRNGLPPVAVHDLVIHPRDRELVIATHGRGLYVMDVTPLEELTPRVLSGTVHLCDPRPVTLQPRQTSGSARGDRGFVGDNPTCGATFYYYLGSDCSEPIQITIAGFRRQAAICLPGSKAAGLHRVTWDLSETGTGGGPGPLVPPGEHAVTLRFGNQVITKWLQIVRPDEIRPGRESPDAARRAAK
jgi:photosystem II stability/assembly factor-like uncharacterized protein